MPFHFCCFVAVETHLQQWLITGVHGCSLGDEHSFSSVYLVCFTAPGTFYSLLLPTISRMSGPQGLCFQFLSPRPASFLLCPAENQFPVAVHSIQRYFHLTNGSLVGEVKGHTPPSCLALLGEALHSCPLFWSSEKHVTTISPKF